MVKNNENQLAKAVADLKDQMRTAEAESERDFKQECKEFSKRLQAKVAGELAKAEAERERQKQIAMMAAMTYLTGGAALPTMAASGMSSTTPAAAKAAPAVAGKTLAATSGMSPGAKRMANFLASRPNATHARTGLPVNADRLPRSAGSPIPVDNDSIYPSWGMDDLVPWKRVVSGLSKLSIKVAGLSKMGSSPYRLPATAPVGRRTPVYSPVDPAAHNPQMKIPAGKPLNLSEMIGGREYTGHALGRMAGRGLLPSIVENTIKVGQKSPGQKAGTLLFFDPRNKVRVILDSASGRVLTVE